jgi:hypothetical protein
MAVPTKRSAGPEPEASHKVMTTDTVIAKRGDIIFKLGKLNAAVTTVKMSSATMDFASPVFEAMLNGSFAEGQARSGNSPGEIPLPDDDAQSILLICKIAHMKTTELPEKLSVDAFTQFAVTSDKYQCAEAVQAWSKVWVAKIFKDMRKATFDKLLVATYVLDLPDEFYQTTVILAPGRSEDVTIGSIDIDYLPDTIMDTLRINKRQSENKAYAVMHEVTKDFASNCRYAQDFAGEFFFAIREVDLCPMQYQSVQQLREKLAKMDAVTTSTTCSFPRSCRCTKITNIKGALITEIDAVYKSVRGMCLEDSRICRIKHV